MFLQNGMKSLGSGKTYHDTVQNGVWNALFEYDSFRSWSPESLPYRNPGWTQGIDFLGCPETRWGGNVTVAWCERELGDMSDVLTVDHAIDLLNGAVTNGTVDTPFYLAVGLHKPHMPWIAKPEHFAMYDLDDIEVAKQKTLNGTDIPEIAFRDCDSPSPYEPLEDDDAKIARRAYYAAVTGMDEELGRFLDALEASGAVEDTAIVLHGDHGWQLGERGMWAKNTNWEAAVRVPLIITAPWIEGIEGTRSDELAELVDIMPTVAELAGIDVPTKHLGGEEWLGAKDEGQARGARSEATMLLTPPPFLTSLSLSRRRPNEPDRRHVPGQIAHRAEGEGGRLLAVPEEAEAHERALEEQRYRTRRT